MGDPNKLGYRNVSMPTWGGDMIFEDGKWHLFITSRADQSTPYDSYSCNVDIRRLEGPSPIGPFHLVETVLSRWHHEVHALDWTLLPYEAWSANVTWTSPWAPNSTVEPSLSTQMFRRQAPSLHVGKDGQPLALLTPVDNNPGDGIHWHTGWTLIQTVSA